MIDFLQNTLDGLALGSSYALLALGFTLIFGVLRRANLAYGPAIMFGCYCATWAYLKTGIGLLFLALIAVAGSALAGVYPSSFDRRFDSARYRPPDRNAPCRPARDRTRRAR